MYYRVELLIQDDIPEDDQAETSLRVGEVMEIVDESGFGVVGRIVSVRIREDREDACPQLF